MTTGVTQAAGVTAIPAGTAGIGSVYGSFQDSTTQTGSTTAGVAFTFNGDDFGGAGGITLVSGSRIKVPATGIYNFQFSAQFSSLDNASTDVWVWVKKNGTADIAGTTGLVGMMPRKSAGVSSHVLPAWNYFLSLNANDYIELYWLKETTNITLTAFAASTSPAYPATPSIIATINQIG